MELRHLRYFVVAAEECHFTRAAKRLGIAQPPLSQQIQQLEEELGFLLFHRLPRGVALTEAGESFLVDVNSVLGKLDSVINDTREIAQGKTGKLNIGFTSTAAYNDFIPYIIGKYREQHPKIVTNLYEHSSALLLKLLRNGELDVAFIRLAQGEGDDLPHDLLIDEEMRLAVQRKHRLAALHEIEMKDLANEKFVMFPRSNGPSLFEAVTQACLDAGFSMEVAQVAPQMASSISLVAAGVGVAFVPVSMSHLHANHVSYLKVKTGGPRAILHFATRSLPLPPPAVRFSTMVKQEIRKWH
ncbi:LysR family transcriptional regulator [Hoeflea alexandrii]|uniref:LysR family transcriptional regulator n=1 Tax=Hoeflea alexandrii TaxID=288436 RepID=UPI0022AF2735|nr:LysR family transcriptional regulator [Hoeflea alexandrii]MCZ4291521.1 LysR family transcriptional regulator [Hoeflea alexandrii]